MNKMLVVTLAEPIGKQYRDDGTIEGAADPRRDGEAIGY